ncbi:MAG: NHLP leader peptide family natural product precursor [Planctomycetia bacterium]|nr:NHLP leader peptide family natural product precursor [Planctomycetia bacterium]
MSSIDVLVSKAIESAEFREKLIANPATAAREAGVALPSGIKVVVHQDLADEAHAVIGGQTEGVPAEALQLLQKAQQDAGFKARLIADPATAAKAEFGIVLPPTLKVCVHENTSEICHLVLPPAEPATGALSDLELEAVAGGKNKPGKPPGGCFGGPFGDPRWAVRKTR